MAKCGLDSNTIRQIWNWLDLRLVKQMTNELRLAWRSLVLCRDPISAFFFF